MMHFLTPDALPHPHPCLRTCIPFTHFSLGPSLKKMGVPPPPPPHTHTLGPALPTLRSHLYCCSHAMKPDGRRANHIIVEKSRPNRKETLSTGCNQCKKQDFQTQDALHNQTYMKVKVTHASQTLHSLHVFRCTHVEIFKKEGFKSY